MSTIKDYLFAILIVLGTIAVLYATWIIAIISVILGLIFITKNVLTVLRE